MTARWAFGWVPWALCLVLGASGASAQVVNWPLERPPRPLEERDVDFPPYEIRTLENGLQVIAVSHHEQPAVTLRLLVRAGSVHDPQGKAGLAGMAAALLDQGTATKSAQEIADTVDFAGALLNTGSGPDLTFVNMIVMKDAYDFGLEMVHDVVRNPAFDPGEIERQQEQATSTLQVSFQDPDYLASVVFDRLVYGFHPYGMPTSGTPETLAAITRADLQAFHRSYFVPNNMVLAVVGDITAEDAFAGVERVFGGWARGEVPAGRSGEPPPPTRRVVVVDVPGAVQTEIRVGQLGVPRGHADYLAFDMAVKILGGEGANRLHRVLRSERGLTYGASADTQAWRLAGDFVAETDTRTETTGEALRLMVDEVSRLQRERVGARELGDAQAYQAGSFPLTIETPNQIATQILDVVLNELPVEEIETYRDRVQAITPDDIQRVARRYVAPDRLSIVLVGNASAFVPQLRQVGFDDFEVIPVQELELMSVTLRREARAAALAPATGGLGLRRASAYLPVSAQAARADSRAAALLDEIVRAKGGLEALRSVRTVVAESQTTFRMEQGTLESDTRTYVVYPDRFRVEATVNDVETVQVFNAGRAWLQDPRGVVDAPPGMREEMETSVRRDMIPMLIAASEGRLDVRALADERRGGDVLRVLEISGQGLDPVRLFVDRDGLVVRQVFSAAGPDGRPEQAEEVFSDYRDVDGVQVPFTAEVVRRGSVILSRRLTSVSFNSPIDERLFQRPS